MIVTTVYIFAGDVLSLINYLSFTSWLFTAMSQLAVIVLRFSMKDAKREYKVCGVYILCHIVLLYCVKLS